MPTLPFKLRVVLVSPEHDSNVGACARVMKNFACKDLALVNPVAPVGFEATKFAKHSLEVLTEAKRYPSITQAVEGFNFVVATSGVADRFKSRLKNCIGLPDLPKLIAPGSKVAIVFGRESIGLLKEELGECDAVCVIPASKEHTVLNLSHAVGVVLYELFRWNLLNPTGPRDRKAKEGIYRKPASRANRQVLEKMFSEMVGAFPNVHDPQKVSAALRNVIERSRASDDEVRAIIAGISPARAAASRKPALR